MNSLNQFFLFAMNQFVQTIVISLHYCKQKKKTKTKKQPKQQRTQALVK